MIDLSMDLKQLDRTVQRARERNIIVPTFAQMKNPELIPDSIKEELKKIGLWDITSRNLFRMNRSHRAGALMVSITSNFPQA
jgi:cysteine synthase A